MKEEEAGERRGREKRYGELTADKRKLHNVSDAGSGREGDKKKKRTKVVFVGEKEWVRV